MNLFNEFIRSAVRQVGRDGGKVISNQIYNQKHSTPIHNSNHINYDLETDSSSTTINQSIQKPIKGGGIVVVLKGVLIQIIPFGQLAVLYKGIKYLLQKDAPVYKTVPNKISDKRYNAGYRIEGSSIIKSKEKRELTPNERAKIKNRGISYLISILIFFSLIFILFKEDIKF